MSISAPTLLHAVAGWVRTIDKCAGTWRIINAVDVTIRSSPWIPYPAYKAFVRVRCTSVALRLSKHICCDESQSQGYTFREQGRTKSRRRDVRHILCVRLGRLASHLFRRPSQRNGRCSGSKRRGGRGRRIMKHSRRASLAGRKSVHSPSQRSTKPCEQRARCTACTRCRGQKGKARA